MCCAYSSNPELFLCLSSAVLLPKLKCLVGLFDLQNDDDDENDDDMGVAYPAGSFRPGKVVWAKVDGHEWWPAKVMLPNSPAVALPIS